MKEFIEKLIEKLEEQRGHICNCMPCNGCKYIGDCNEGEFAEDVALDKAIEIVNQLAEEYKPKTNADRIRSMTDEELAEFFNGLSTICEMCTDCLGCLNVENNRCKKGILDWLQSEAE